MAVRKKGGGAKRGPKRRTLRSWSFSTWSKEQSCPARVAYEKLDGREDPSGPAADKGKFVHKLFEDYARAKLLELREPPDVFVPPVFFPPAYQRWRPGLDQILSESDDVIPELAIALTRTWKETSWERAVLRGAIDLVYIENDSTIGCIDYKTGRVYPEHGDQLKLYATLLFHRYPWAQRVKTADWYLELPDTAERTFTRGDYERTLLPFWEGEHHRILKRTSWPARRNDKCKWCPHHARRGGPCIEGK